MADSFIENIFCGRVMKERDDNSIDLTVCSSTLSMKVGELEAKISELTILKKQLAQAQDALTATDSKNKAEIAELQKQITTLQDIITSHSNVIDAMYLQASAQTSFTMLPKNVQIILIAYHSKYPEAEVIYTGRTLPGRADKPFSMRVQNWAQAGIGIPEAVMCVKAAKAYPLDIMKEKNCTFHRACDIGAMRMKIWMTSGIPYKYQLDNATTGINEFWKFFIELYYSMKRYGIGDDCDGWAVAFYILCRTAGIPKELIRIVACTTRGGEGHATNSYFASDCTWRHINSTTPYSIPSLDILNLPKLDDQTDSMGPASTWFSFDEETSWSGDAGTKAQSFLGWAGYQLDKLPKMLKNVKVKLL